VNALRVLVEFAVLWCGAGVVKASAVLWEIGW
jgi:hypothetical protein